MKRMVLALAAFAGPTAAEPPPGTLDGVWTNAFLTSMERRKEFNALTVPEAEARAFEEKPPKIQEEDPVGQEDSEFPERGPGLARIRGQARTSWIYSTADGKTPWTPAAAAANKARRDGAKVNYANVEQRPLPERCLGAAFAGPPLVNGPDLSVHTIVETPDHVVIASEYINNTRIIRIGGKHGPAALKAWMGDSVGRWEGRTLVVETINFHPDQFLGPGDVSASARHKVTERFTRISPSELHYEFKVENPDLYTQSWRGEMVFRPAPSFHEYACHEGNYALTNILAGGRTSDAAPPPAEQKRAD